MSKCLLYCLYMYNTVYVSPGVSGHSLTNISLVLCFHQSLW